MLQRQLFFSIVFVSAFAATAVGQSATYIGPTPYLCTADSPFDQSGLGTTFFLETFEDGLLDTPGVSASAGTIHSAPFMDAVDCDDGTINGLGVVPAHSFVQPAPATGITFTFDAGVLGALPTRVGLVWTDGFGLRTSRPSTRAT